MKNFLTHKFNFSLNFVYTFLFSLLLLFSQSVYGQSLNFNDWTRHGIVLDVGAPGSWDDEAVGEHCVILEDNTYKMWYSGYDGTNVRIGYATSPDGITWTKYQTNPVLNIGDPGLWDDYWVARPEVLHIDTVYHMWYGGDNGAVVEYIGHATSPDGINWTRDPENPVFQPSGNWDFFVFTGHVSFENGTFHMWYCGQDQSLTYVRTGYATATNPYGKNWTNHLNPVLDIGPFESWDYPSASCGSVVFVEDVDEYYMFYFGGGYFTTEIGVAYSPDKVSWYKDPLNPIFKKGEAGNWDDFHVGSPSVLFDTLETKMWYMGGRGVLEGKIGLATGPPLPVELISFTATSQLGTVILNWTTATEINNLGFEIERASSTTTPGQEKLWRTIGFVPGMGTTTEPQEYSYIDDISETNATSLVYRLKQMDFLGTYEYSDEVLVDNPAPLDYVLYQNYPNPFNPTTTITFGIPVNTHVLLKVFNAVGEEVAQLYNGEKEAGRYTIEFSAERLPSGIYFYQLRAGDYTALKKMILIK